MRTIFRLIALFTLFLATMVGDVQPSRSAESRKFDTEIDFALRSMPTNVQTIAVTSLLKEDLGATDVALLRPEFGEWQIHLLRLMWLLADTREDEGVPRVCIDCVTSGTIDSSTHANQSCQFLFVDESPSFLDSFSKQTSGATGRFLDSGFSVIQLAYRKSAEHVTIPPNYYLSRVRSGIIVGTTDKSLLHEILSRLQAGSAKSKRALPDSLEEWSNVDSGAPFWAIRHFKKGDPTSPSSRKNGKKIFDGGATGMTFSYRPQEHRLVLGYLSKNSNLEKAARTVFGIDEVKASQLDFTQKRLKPSVSTIEVKTADGQFPHFFFHRLAFWLGD